MTLPDGSAYADMAFGPGILEAELERAGLAVGDVSAVASLDMKTLAVGANGKTGIELADFTIETVPDRFRRLGDLTQGIDDREFPLEPLLELVERQEREGLGDAPWPPQFPKAEGEPKRVQPSRARKEPNAVGAHGNAPAPSAVESPTGRRKSIHPLLVISKAAHKDEAIAGLERWKQRYPEAAKHLKPSDILVDSMRGMSTTWTRIRVNLRNVPEDQRPQQEPPDPDYDPWAGLDPSLRGRHTRFNPEDGRL